MLGVIAAIDDLAGDLVQELGYAGLVVLMAVEHVFPPIPSELVLPLAGFEVGRGNLSFAGALAAATPGSLLGAGVLYAPAWRGGRPLVLRLYRVLRFYEAISSAPSGASPGTAHGSSSRDGWCRDCAARCRCRPGCCGCRSAAISR